jgi:hypothetical protein
MGISKVEFEKNRNEMKKYNSEYDDNEEYYINNYVDRIHEPTQWNVYIVMDIDEDTVYAKPKPALDKNGCLILRRI